jgi:Carboxypeptidase regulatory-like domain
MTRIGYLRFMFVVLALVLSASVAFSQSATTGNITGRAQDSSAALIPGVEVSVSSPSMIGGARSAITDETGSYRFTLLPAGTYRVTFVLPGFKTLNIDGVNVTPGATATINGPLEVASTSEEVTVTSQAPAIDLEAATVGVNWDIHKLDDLPYSRSLVALNSMVPGVFFTGTYDVGGSSFGTGSAVSGRTFGRSGNNVMAIDGLVWCQGYADYGSFEEINFSTASKGADQANAGLTMQMVVKSGSNQFHGNVTTSYERGAWHPFGQSTNIDAKLIARGFSTGSNKFVFNRQSYGDIGGPILKDKFWFYFSYSDGQLNQLIPGYIDFSNGQTGVFTSKIQNPTTKLTYQLNQKMKLEASWPLDLKTQPYRNASDRVPLQATQNQHSWATYGPNLKWTDIVGPKTTATAAINRGGYWWPDIPWSGPGVDQYNVPTVSTGIPTLANANDVRRVDTTSGGATLGPQLAIYRRPIRWTWTGDVSRFQTIGGRNHELKVGYTGWWTKSYTTNFGYPNQQIYRYASLSTEPYPTTITPEGLLNGFQHPNSVQVIDYPNTTISAFGYKAFYVNDKITINRKLNVTAGLRFDHYNSWLPAQGRKGLGPAGLLPDGGASTLPANQNFAAEFLYPDIPSSAFPSTTRANPRLSMAYDVKGDGKLAFKASYGRYTAYSSGIGSSFAGSSTVNPNATTTCTYTGWKGDIPFHPVAGNFTSVSCTGGGGSSTPGFDKTNPATWPNKLDSNLKSDYLDEFTTGLDVGFNRDYSLRISVVRKFDHPQTKQIDLAQPFEAYTAAKCYNYNAATNTLTANATATTPSGGLDSGVACVWSVPSTWATKGQVNNLTVNLRPGEGKNQYTSYEVAFNKQNSNGWSFLASYDISMRHENANDSVTPNALFYRTDIPIWDQGIKMNGTYQLPWYGLQWASTFGIQSGNQFNRAVQIKNADGTNVTQTFALNVGRYPWVNLWDQRFTKRFRIGEKQSVEAYYELFNTANANMVTNQGTTIGPSTFLGADKSLYKPSAIVSPRISQFTVKYRF